MLENSGIPHDDEGEGDDYSSSDNGGGGDYGPGPSNTHEYTDGSSSMHTMPPNNEFKQPGGLEEVREMARHSMEHAPEPNSSGWIPPIFSKYALDWGFNPNRTTTTSTGQCQLCQILRRIIHTNGMQDLKLEIHGLKGEPRHAVTGRRLSVDDGSQGSLTSEIIEFPTKNAENVKLFIARYKDMRRNEGYVLRYDSFMLNTDGGKKVKKKKVGNRSKTKPLPSDYTPRTEYAAQRQRTATMQMLEVAKCFHVTEDDACAKLRVCSTFLKEFCREHNIERWPYRKINPIRCKIKRLKEQMNSENEEKKKNTRIKIAALRDDLAMEYRGYPLKEDEDDLNNNSAN